MNFRELLIFVLAGWTVVGAAGITISLVKRERAKALRNSVWVVVVWAVYMAVVVGASRTQPQKIVALGQDQCFDKMCFAVTEVQELPEFQIQDGSRLIRVSVRISNRDNDKKQNHARLRAYLVDKQGRQWTESAAVSGVSLTAGVAAGASVVSQPVFRVPQDATGLGLVLTQGRGWPWALVIGNSD
ncbi:MAG: hypothetical protein ABI158_14760, partial [Edaphobacter sp.]